MDNSELLEVLKNIDLRLKNIEYQLNIKLTNIETDCSKMNNHINFVENTYNRVRIPLNYIKNKIEIIIGASNNNELPLIESSENKNNE
jgi:hypothetical protein